MNVNPKFNSFNDTQREKLCFAQFITRMAASDLFHMFTQSIKFYTKCDLSNRQ